MILLTKFANERNVTADAVSTYIRRHKDEFEGHTKRQGNKLLLDDDALIILDEVYPLQKPIEVIEDTESRKKLILAQERIIQLQTQLSEKEQLIAQAEAVKLLLEDKKAELNATRQQLDAKEQQFQELQEKYEHELKKSWWDKLRGK